MSSENKINLYKAVLSLKNEDACRRFFKDICTPKELKDLEDRLMVAQLLLKGLTYEKITEKTGMSSATIARVNRALVYGEGGYKEVLTKD
ncbi:MAG: TrpR-like protein [Clostridium sp.]|nr:TrpR-like protein [Clostridium sp.]